MYILSQVLVGVADLLYVCSMLSKRKIWLTLFLFLSDLFFAFHYLCLNALIGCIIIFIDAAFLITAFILEKYKKEKYIFIAVIVAFVGIIITSIFTWAGPISLLPIFGMSAYLTGMLFKNIVFTKTGALVRNVLNIVYLILITSYVGAGLEFALMISAVVGIVLSYRKLKEKDIEQVENTEEKGGENEHSR